MRGTTSRKLEAAPLIADPAGDADRQLKGQVVFEFALTAGEAVRNPAGEAGAIFREDRGEVLVRVALMQEYRLRHAHRDFQLRDEGRALRRSGR